MCAAQSNVLKLTAKRFITHKQAETVDDCQDACEVNENEDVGRYAIADGATLSFMSKPWAALLVKHFCKTTGLSLTKDNWQEWLRPIQQEWYQQVEEDVKALKQYWLTNSFNTQESATSTFIGLDIDKVTSKWKAIIIGDSCLFHLDDPGFKSYLIKDSTNFTNRPNAFTSFEKDNHHAPILVQGDVKQGNTFILATDALAKWILAHKEAGKLETVCDALKAIETDIEFCKFVETERSSESIRLVNDDVTLMQISASL